MKKLNIFDLLSQVDRNSQMIRKYFYLLLIPFAFALMSGCGVLFHKDIDEGVIEFEISYPATEAGDLMAGLLPREMTLKFKDGKTIGELSAGMGVFKTALIADPETRTVHQLLKIMSKKYVLELDSNEIHQLYGELPEMKVHFTDETKEIAGYKCHKAVVTFKNNIKEEFSIFYTNDIDIEDSNWCTPFNEISGVLLEYHVRKYNYEMKLTAIKVTKIDIDDADFIVPSDYIQISQDEMDKIFEGFQDI